jgi:hypothetical protein
MIAFGRLLMILGVVIAVAGLLIWLGGRYLPWLGNLPGDLRYETDNVKVYFPLVTMILVSIIGTIILNIILRFFNR